MNRVLAHWRDMPTPPGAEGDLPTGSSIHVNEAALVHIVTKHVCNRDEPWETWISAESVERLRSWADQPGRRGDRQALGEFAGKLETAAREALGRPLLLRYLSRAPWQEPFQAVADWLLIAPSGAAMVIKLSAGRGYLATAYLPSIWLIRAAVGPAWRETLEQLIRRHCDYEPGLGFRPPGPEKTVIIRDEETHTPNDVRHGFEFITHETWGFTSDELGEHRWVAEAIPDWDGTATPRVEGFRLHRIKPRRQKATETEI